MRIAYLGPVPTDGGGVGFMATQVIGGLADLGIKIDVYLDAAVAPAGLSARGGVRFRGPASRWRYDRWYSRTDLSKHVSGAASRVYDLRRTGTLLAAAHAENPYDVVYQFSAPELVAVRPHRAVLPPIVVHPEVHAAGELRWHRAEQALALRCEPRWRHFAMRAMLATRARSQHRDLRLADLVIAPSDRFRELILADHGLDPVRVSVVPNPIDIDRFADPGGPRVRPLKVLFVSRIAVRKGVDAVVALSHRLADLQGTLEIEIVGDRSLWSDYRRLLDDLDPAIAIQLGGIPAEAVAERLQQASILVQPSRYEPFGLTAGEALASGVVVVSTDEVGATEHIDPAVAVRVPSGDIGALEAAMRRLVAELADPRRADELRRLARREAERRLAPGVVAAQLAGELERAAALRSSSSA